MASAGAPKGTSLHDAAYWGHLAGRAVTDAAAFTELYEHFFPRVYRHLMSKTRDEALADELASDTFLRMYRYLSAYDPERGTFSTWLFRIARNVILEHSGRKEQTMHVPLTSDIDIADSEAAEPETVFFSREESEEIRRAMMQLTERQRRALEMKYWFSMKSGEIGEAMGIDAATVRSTLKQARDRLKAILCRKAEEKQSGSA